MCWGWWFGCESAMGGAGRVRGGRSLRRFWRLIGGSVGMLVWVNYHTWRVMLGYNNSVCELERSRFSVGFSEDSISRNLARSRAISRDLVRSGRMARVRVEGEKWGGEVR